MDIYNYIYELETHINILKYELENKDRIIEELIMKMENNIENNIENNMENNIENNIENKKILCVIQNEKIKQKKKKKLKFDKLDKIVDKITNDEIKYLPSPKDKSLYGYPLYFGENKIWNNEHT